MAAAVEASASPSTNRKLGSDGAKTQQLPRTVRWPVETANSRPVVLRTMPEVGHAAANAVRSHGDYETEWRHPPDVAVW
jgi:hypothetical protein